MIETYVRRLEELERITNTFKGVEKSYAVQAGREVRIIVQHDLVSDEEAARMAREIARKIESEMTYPGQIKVTVIREVRAVDYAR
jgi:ribonuclease Y